jgi:hypothetical protein
VPALYCNDPDPIWSVMPRLFTFDLRQINFLFYHLALPNGLAAENSC